jgi:hypothetical protein
LHRHLLQINPPKGTKTLLIFRINLQIIQASGKHFFWKKPLRCPKCGGIRLWGHGFVLRYFFGFVSGIWMKRWRCPDCRGVHTARPVQYSPGVQYPRHLQIRSVSAKLSGKNFLSCISRQIQQHWKKVFYRKSRQNSNWPKPLDFLQSRLESGQFHLTKRIIYYETAFAHGSAYLPFALTAVRHAHKLE